MPGAMSTLLPHLKLNPSQNVVPRSLRGKGRLVSHVTLCLLLLEITVWRGGGRNGELLEDVAAVVK